MTNDMTPQAATVGLAAGTRIGKYEVKERIAMGGQAIVYKCYDAVLDRFVAIKQISSHLAADPKFLERFRREAQILAKLCSDQPAIIMVHDLLEDERGLFIVMEYVPGPTLETVLAETPGPTEAKAVLQVLWRLASALYDVHKAGVIHRDIKPANIIIASGLRPKITDFGVAASITGQTSMVLGTTKYMAPELYSGGAVDGRADMYSLGFIAYELLVGRTKFNEIFEEVVRDKHSEALRWMKWHGNETVTAPRVREVNPAVPENLSNIIAKMIAKKPEDRFESMEALGRAIKVTFSPRAKTGAADARLPRQYRAAAAVKGGIGGVSGATSVVKMDEGDELELGAATAPLPKKKMTRKTKIILGSVVGVAIIGVVATMLALKNKENIRKAENVRTYFAKAEQTYKDGNYVAAATMLEMLRPYTDYPESGKARVLVHMASAKLIMIDANMDIGLAARETDDARANLQELQQKWQNRKDIDEWVREKRMDVTALEEERSVTQKYREAIGVARRTLIDGKPEEAVVKLNDMLKGIPILPWQEEERSRFIRDCDSAKFRSALQTAMMQADEMFDSKNSGALEKYNRVLALLASKDAQIMPKEERKEIYDKVSSRIRQMKTQGTLDAARKKVDDAQTPEEKKQALIELYALQPSPEIKEQVTAIEKAMELNEAMKAAGSGDPKAVALLEAYLAKDPANGPARDELAKLKNKGSYQNLVKTAENLMGAGQYAQAIEKYTAALNITGVEADPGIQEKINACRYQMAFTEAEKAYTANDYATATRLFLALREKYPDKAEVINPRLTAMEQNQKVADLNSRAEAALAQGKYEESKRIFKEVKKALTDSAAKAEVDRKIATADYRKYMQDAAESMGGSKYNEAKANYSLAREAAIKAGMDTKEVDALIKKADSLAKEK